MLDQEVLSRRLRISRNVHIDDQRDQDLGSCGPKSHEFTMSSADEICAPRPRCVPRSREYERDSEVGKAISRSTFQRKLKAGGW